MSPAPHPHTLHTHARARERTWRDEAVVATLQVMCSVAESGDVRLQRPAAAGLANLAVDDSLLQPLPPAFLPSLLSLCDCPDQDVQVRRGFFPPHQPPPLNPNP